MNDIVKLFGGTELYTKEKVDTITEETRAIFDEGVETDTVQAREGIQLETLTTTEPIESPLAVGYDENGNLIPIHTTASIQLPPNATFIKTTADGTAVVGTPDDNLDEDSVNMVTNAAITRAVNEVRETAEAALSTAEAALSTAEAALSSYVASSWTCDDNLNISYA